MKLTTRKRDWVMGQVTRYCQSLAVACPQTFLTSREYKEWKQRAENQRREAIEKLVGTKIHLPRSYIRVGVNPSKSNGVWHRQYGVLFVNIKRHKNLSGIGETLERTLGGAQ